MSVTATDAPVNGVVISVPGVTTIADNNPRPDSRSREVVEKVAQELLKKIGTAAANACAQNSNHTTVDAIAGALRSAKSLDGYVLARYLEDFYGWEANASLVVQLSNAETLLKPEVDKAVQAWIKHVPVKQEYVPGDKATFRVVEHYVEAVVWKVEKREAYYYATLCEDGQQVKIGFEYALPKTP